jgi:glycosyltransferase involved in cell wall biosynthesis
MGEENKRSVAIIIPAYNEEGRIGTVLRAATGSKLASEIIVVCDGCKDRTAEVARRFKGVTVYELPFNQGKAAAMAAGVRLSKADIVAFADADLLGLEPEHIDQIIRPVLHNFCDMCIGVFRGGKFWSDTAQKISPYISGQRAMRRQLFEAVPNIQDQGMGVEMAITAQARRVKARVLRVVLRGVSNCHKEQKLGFGKGMAARVKMYKEIGQTIFSGKGGRKPPRWRKKNSLRNRR